MIGDKYGRHAILHVDRTGGTVLTLVALGEVCSASRPLRSTNLRATQASSPMTLTYLTNQVVYLGSHFGDSQLLQIVASPISSTDSPTLPVPASIRTIKPIDLSMLAKNKIDEDAEGIIVNGTGSYLIELESFNNLAPIVDGVLVDTDNSAQVCVNFGILGNVDTLYRTKLLRVPEDGIQVH